MNQSPSQVCVLLSLPKGLGDPLVRRGMRWRWQRCMLSTSLPHDMETWIHQAGNPFTAAGIEEKRAMTETQAQPSALSQFSDQLASVVEKAARSIVTVAARPRQTATGILWRAETETIILTADHVIEREDEINVTLPDKREVKAQLIGRDPSTDLAALRISGVDLGN